MNQITFKQYRRIDLTIWTVLLVLFETLTTFATTKWFVYQPIALSISLALVCVTMMRWGGYAAILAAIGGFVFCIVSGANVEQYFIYCIGNLFALLSLLIIRLFGKEKIRQSIPRLMLFVLAAYLGMAFGRWGVSLIFGGDFMTLVVYITTDVISLLFAELILILFRRSDGMLEDQKAYLFRLERERKEEESAFETDERY